jgi:hypothetical protein
MKYLKRFREPSTWAGIAGLVAVFNPAAGLTIKTLGIGIASVLAIVIPESGKIEN